MKKRAFTLLNFLALNVLFFAVYLNFIHKDTNVLPAVAASSAQAARQLTSAPEKQPVAANLPTKVKVASLAN